LGRQTRSHDDLDVVVDDFDTSIDTAVGALSARGFRIVSVNERAAWMPRIVELHADSGRRVELVSLNWQSLAQHFAPGEPVSSARHSIEHCVHTDGSIDGRPVPCLSAEVQLLFHTRFPLDPEMQRDVVRLRDELERPSRSLTADPAPGDKHP
jgi:lincosamide nucleotidyltransferase A/C/D/E